MLVTSYTPPPPPQPRSPPHPSTPCARKGNRPMYSDLRVMQSSARKRNVVENFDDGEKNQSSHLKVKKKSLSRSKFERAWASQHRAMLPQVPGSRGEQGVDSIMTEERVQ